MFCTGLIAVDCDIGGAVDVSRAAHELRNHGISVYGEFSLRSYDSAGTCGFRRSVCRAGATLNDMLHREATRQLVDGSSWEPGEAQFFLLWDFVGGSSFADDLSPAPSSSCRLPS